MNEAMAIPWETRRGFEVIGTHVTPELSSIQRSYHGTGVPREWHELLWNIRLRG
ncbi:hypothetical protein X777_08056 [Ooceraea biroi]|uniref:Uncharacterized protein n=1 Tax=Ooceraea biroi TaxID=2015173 RepID=A0A026W9A3_OOCBI|nr:hypothetical protein X777_08056 [Ooceraea biroi]